MAKRLEGKVVVVTGASRGIGTGIAEGLADTGASVVVNDSRGKGGADGVVSEIASPIGRAIAVQGDMSKAADIGTLFEEAVGAFGRLDVLVNNAGIFRSGPVESVTRGQSRPGRQPQARRRGGRRSRRALRWAGPGRPGRSRRPSSSRFPASQPGSPARSSGSPRREVRRSSDIRGRSGDHGEAGGQSRRDHGRDLGHGLGHRQALRRGGGLRLHHGPPQEEAGRGGKGRSAGTSPAFRATPAISPTSTASTRR